MTFKQAKAVIRAALREAPDAKLVNVLTAARAGQVKYWDGNCAHCFAGRLIGSARALRYTPDGSPTRNWWSLSRAYKHLDWYGSELGRDGIRQRIITVMILAEIARRERARSLDAIETVTTVAALVGERA